jgi:hypothetical protein
MMSFRGVALPVHSGSRTSGRCAEEHNSRSRIGDVKRKTTEVKDLTLNPHSAGRATNTSNKQTTKIRPERMMLAECRTPAAVLEGELWTKPEPAPWWSARDGEIPFGTIATTPVIPGALIPG